jgi:TolA-binding protein
MAGAGSKKEKSVLERVQQGLKQSLSDSYHDENVEAKLAEAESFFQAQEYEKAQAIFADIAKNSYNSASSIERSRFMEGECLRLRKRLPAAVDAYNRMLQDFPAGVYSERAAGHMYDIAEIWLKDVVKDIQETDSGRTFSKKFRLPNPADTTRPWIDMEGELVKTLENVVNGAPTAPFADKALFWAGYLHFVRGSFEDADHFFSQLVDAYKDSPLRQEALKYAVIAKNNSTGGPVYDGQKTAEALSLVHHMEATDPRYVQDQDKSKWLTRQKMAIRIQQAQKDFEQAEYYERSGHPGSAYFYYDMVIRRYPGTKYSDQAKEKLIKLDAAKNAKPKVSAPWWDQIMSKTGKKNQEGPDDPSPHRRPNSRPTDALPSFVPASFNNQ